MSELSKILVVLLLIAVPVIIMLLLLEQWKPRKGERLEEMWVLIISFAPALLLLVVYLLQKLW